MISYAYLGQTLPLAVQLATSATSKFIKAYLTDNANVAIGSALTLTAQGSLGLYTNTGFTMPNKPVVVVQYCIYDDSGFTVPSTTVGGCSDVFILNNLLVGSNVPLVLQLPDYNLSKYVKAAVYSGATALTGSPVTLTQVAHGLYTNFALVAPTGATSLVAEFTVYDDAGYTTLSTSESASSDIFIVGTNSVDPGVGSVLNLVAYTIAGVAKTGTYVAPASSDPGIASVLNGVTYEISGVNKTGTYVPPISIDPGVGNVLSPASGGPASYEISGVVKVGSYIPLISTDPGVQNVLAPINYEISGVSKVGTYIPSSSGNTVSGGQIVSTGTNLPLSIQLSDYSVTKYVKAYLTDYLNTMLSGSPVILNNAGNGLYTNTSVPVPTTPFIIAQYLVYDDAAYTKLSTTEGASNDTFIVNALAATSPMPLAIQLFDCNTTKYVKATVLDATGTAIVNSPVTLTNVGTGLYTNFSLLTSTSPYYVVQYLVYDDASFTTLSISEGAGADLLFLGGGGGTAPIFIVPTPITIGTLPNVSEVLYDYFQQMVFTQITKSVVNFQNKESKVDTVFRGVWQPYSAQQLQMLPRGQRAWRWIQLHSDITLVLNPDDVVTYQGTQYRVSSKTDYSNYGYYEYHLVSDYTGSGP
jgi:hypothetical protein